MRAERRINTQMAQGAPPKWQQRKRAKKSVFRAAPQLIDVPGFLTSPLGLVLPARNFQRGRSTNNKELQRAVMLASSQTPPPSSAETTPPCQLHFLSERWRRNRRASTARGASSRLPNAAGRYLSRRAGGPTAGGRARRARQGLTPHQRAPAHPWRRRTPPAPALGGGRQHCLQHSPHLGRHGATVDSNHCCGPRVQVLEPLSASSASEQKNNPLCEVLTWNIHPGVPFCFLCGSLTPRCCPKVTH